MAAASPSARLRPPARFPCQPHVGSLSAAAANLARVQLTPNLISSPQVTFFCGTLMSLLQFTARRLVSQSRCCGVKKRFRLEMARPSSSKKCILLPLLREILEGFVQEVKSVFQFRTFRRA